MKQREIRVGIVGGGRGSFAGPVHRMAILLTGEGRIVAGAPELDSTLAESTGREMGLERIYHSYHDMLAAERALPEDKRIDCVVIATPNNSHHEIAKAFLEAGFPVVCEKPLTCTLDEAKSLAVVARKANVPFMLTHNYSGYPLVKEARDLIRAGVLGDIKEIFVEYIQGWLLPPVDQKRMQQIGWRLDPAVAGKSTCLTDIGSHAEHLTRYITGLELTSVCADLTRSEGRVLDDSAHILTRFNNGAKGVLIVTQTAAGEENNLRVRIYGSKAGLEWAQMEPNTLLLKRNGKPTEIIRAGTTYIGSAAKANTRIPAGHPEAFIEAFANLYMNYFTTLRAYHTGSPVTGDFPTVHDGVATLAFIEAAVESDCNAQAWTELDLK